MTSNIKISVCIPTYNGEKKIVTIINALEQQSIQDFETIIGIDGSSDSTEEILKSLHPKLNSFRFISSKNVGRAKIRNLIANNSQGDLLIFFDDDMRPTKDCIKLHLNHHQEIKNSILVGAQLEDLKKCITDIQKYKAHLSRKWLPAKKEKVSYPFITAANFSIPKELFSNLNGFDERLTDAEDYDLAIRAFEKNINIYLDPKIIAWHDDFITYNSYVLRQREYQNSQKELMRINSLASTKYNKRAYHPKNGLKQFILTILATSTIFNSINKEAIWLKLLPKKIRYKIYDLSIIALAKEFPNKKIL